MANNYINLPVEGGGGGAGVTSLNAETGDVVIVGGTNITVTPSGQNITIAQTSSGIHSINTDTTAAQVITSDGAGTDVSVATSAGTTTISVPSASATARGVVTTGTQTIAGAKTFSSAPTLSSLSASQAVVTNGSKVLSSLQYTSSNAGSTLVQRDSNGNASFNNVNGTTTTTVTSGQIITLSGGSGRIQKLTGTSTITIKMPDATTLVTGWVFEINNNSTGTATIQDNSAGAIATVPGGGYLYVICTDNSTVAGTWDSHAALASTATSGTTGTTVPGSMSANQLISTVATGTAPLVVSSTTQVANLNAATAGSATSATTATTATNIAGGAGGSIPYQSAASTTAMLSNGTVGQFLVSAGGTSAPTWGNTNYSGTLSTMNSTTGVDGQTFWNTTYKCMFQWIVDRWWPAGYIDKRYGFYIEDEFIGSDRIGQLDWQTGGTQTIAAGNLLNPGIYQVAQSTASSLSYLLSQTNNIQLGTMDLYFEAIVNIPTLSNGTDNAVFVVGLTDGTSFDSHGKPTDGVYFSLDYAVDTTHWNTNTCSNGTNTQKTSVISAGVPAAGTWYRMGIYVNAGTSATFYINGTAITTAHTTNLPTGAGRQTGYGFTIGKTLGSGSLSMQMDSVVVYGFFNGSRT